MSIVHSPPRRKPNKNQTNRSGNGTMENPSSPADESNERTMSEPGEQIHPGIGKQNSTANKSMQGNNSQDNPNSSFRQSPLIDQALQPVFTRMNYMEETMNTLLDKINEIISQMLIKEPEKTKTKKIGKGKETENPTNDDETDYSGDSEPEIIIHRNNNERQPPSIGNKPADRPSSAFTPYSSSDGFANPSRSQIPPENTRINDNRQRSNPLFAGHGSVERELRHVRFHSSLNAPERPNPLNANTQPPRIVNDIIQPPEQKIPYLIRVKIGQPLPNGQIIDEEVFVTEQQYRQMLNPSIDFQDPLISQRGATQSILNDRARSISRASTYSFDPNNFASSTQRAGVDQQPPRTRRGNLSWRSSDSSDDEQYNYPINRASSSGTQVRSTVEHIPRGRTENHYPFPNNNGQPSPLKIGQVVNSWKISFPKTEKDPEQFLLILKDLLSSSGIQKDLFVPCLSKLFEGAYRSWYLVNKASWRSWKEFVRAFRSDWVVKKADADLLYEVRDLIMEKNESLAEFACRARLIFERMQTPPFFREQLRQILTKFNPRLTCEVLNLGHVNYTQFFHYINERSYLYQRSNAQHNNNTSRRSMRATELKVMQRQTYSSDESDEDNTASDEENFTDQDAEQEIGLKFIKNNKSTASITNSNKSSKSTDSKTLTRQRLEQNLERFDNSGQNIATSSAADRNKSNQNKVPFDPTKLFCVNCGQTAHTARYCRSDRQIVCYICRKIGHETKNCPTQQGNANSPR